MSLTFIASIVGPFEHNAKRVIDHIKTQQNLGNEYPRKQTELTTKLEEGSVEDQWAQKQRLFADPNRPAERAGSPAYEMTQTMLAGDFPYVPMKSLVEILSNHKNHLYPTYIATMEIVSNNMFKGAPLPWVGKTCPSPLAKRYEGETLVGTLSSSRDPTEHSLILELLLSRLVKGQQSLRLFMQLNIRSRDIISLQQTMASGRVHECESCFAEYPLNRLIHCDGHHPHVSHGPFSLYHPHLASCIQLFCPKCCATNAETQISQSKHELRCMSIEDCSAGFSVGEQAKYLSADHIKALGRIEKDYAV
ncbi:hypothetical protein CEP52_006268 [Fusarium oligoseptatum]|uniref:Uncharacterized protein n=1 Tax=Fusarium oligoseptatum TaxID=2604345 RepID=A0A428TU06_9HYPO|nr:hypothetical protein CEP52_006268 [Fusarium oligoseptatum]